MKRIDLSAYPNTPEGRELLLSDLADNLPEMTEKEREQLLDEFAEGMQVGAGGQVTKLSRLTYEHIERELRQLVERVESMHGIITALAQTHDYGKPVFSHGRWSGMLMIASGTMHTVADGVQKMLAKDNPESSDPTVS